MSVFKRKDREVNPWLYKFKHKGQVIRGYGYATRKEAQDAEALKRLELLANETPTTHMPFSGIVNKRMDAVKAYCTQNHYRENVTMLRRFADWEDIDIGAITPDIIREKLIEIAGEKGNHRANKHLVALKSVFELAVNDGTLARNPCRGIRFFPAERAPKFIPSKDQISQVLLLANPLDRAYLTTIWLTAARVREVNNLAWEDVDFERRTIRLWTRKKRGGHKTPRIVDMADKVFDALQYVWKNRDKNSPWVFPTPTTGKPYDYRDKFFDRLCRLAGVPEMGYHALRHYAASAMADANVPLTAIQAILGHEAVTTTNNYLQALGVSKAEGIKSIEGGK